MPQPAKDRRDQLDRARKIHRDALRMLGAVDGMAYRERAQAVAEMGIPGALELRETALRLALAADAYAAVMGELSPRRGI